MHSVTDVDGLLKIMKTLQGEKTQKEYAETIGISPQYLNDVYNSRRAPGETILGSLGVTTAYVIPETLTRTISASAPQENTNASKESRKEIVPKVRRKR